MIEIEDAHRVRDLYSRMIESISEDIEALGKTPAILVLTKHDLCSAMLEKTNDLLKAHFHKLCSQHSAIKAGRPWPPPEPR